MTQNSLWQTNKDNHIFSELCNALYERELRSLAHVKITSAETLQGKLKSLPHYVTRTANLMVQVDELGHSPLTLDSQNASWSVKQASRLPLLGQNQADICAWYFTGPLSLGLVVPVLTDEHIILDCIDHIDNDKNRIRTNVHGWFSLADVNSNSSFRLLKPNKKVLLAACAGHCWQHDIHGAKLRPIMPTLRELLISCSINWQNFHQPSIF